MNNADQPAFPCMQDGEYKYGLTKRELAAFMAMQGMMSDAAILKAAYDDGNGDPSGHITETAYAIADAMLEELEKANKQSPLTKEEVSDFNERFGYFEYGDAQGGKSRAFVKAIEEKHGIHQSP